MIIQIFYIKIILKIILYFLIQYIIVIQLHVLSNQLNLDIINQLIIIINYKLLYMYLIIYCFYF